MQEVIKQRVQEERKKVENEQSKKLNKCMKTKKKNNGSVMVHMLEN